VRKTLAALAAYKIQNIVAAPQSLLKFTEEIESHPGYCSPLAAAFSAGGMEARSAERIRARLCSNLTVGHMALDATMIASMPSRFASGIPGAAGYVLPGVTVEIVDDQDNALPPGQDGNLRIRSDYGVKEYLDDPDETQWAFRNGWFYPRDRGHLTSEGMLVISRPPESDRAADVERVEQILVQHANVAQCGVIAVANKSGASELCAFVVPRSYLDAEALRNYCRARLPGNLIPSRFIPLSDLPRNESGEVNRVKLPQLLTAE
jgi:crotonobetaine/carnitine-CoA ligase